MPRHRTRQRLDETDWAHQSEAARIIGIRRQNLGRWVARLDAEERGGRLYFTRASCERVRDERLAMLAKRAARAAERTAAPAA